MHRLRLRRRPDPHRTVSYTHLDVYKRQGLYLLDHVCEAARVIVLDAIDFKLPPGTLKVFRDGEVPVWSDTVMSLHQASFQELLSLARLRDRFPQRITLIGVQPDVLDLSLIHI